jgi:DNA-binding NtrC family response regulator
VLAATSHSLEARLREELYYRLSVFQIVLPPLRERKEDIPLIAEVMLQILNEKHGTSVSGLDSGVLELFHTYDWPGNVRELRNVIERAAIVTRAGLLRLDHLPSPAFGSRPGRKTPQVPGHGSPAVLPPGQQLAKLEAAYISLTLEHVRGNRKRAAEMLGISLRTLQNRIAILRKEETAATPAS